MRIAIDARMINWTGVGRYTTHLLDELQAIDRENEYVVVLLPDDADVWRPKNTAVWSPSAPNFKVVKINAPPYHPVKEQFGFSRALKELDADLVHFTNINRPAFYREPNATTVHDLNMLDRSQVTAWYKSYKWLGVKLVADKVIKTTDQIIAPSEEVGSEIAHSFPGAQNKTAVIYEAGEALSDDPRPIAALGNTDFIAYVGNGLPNKNLPRLLEAFATLSRTQKSIKLALVGNLTQSKGHLIKQAEELRVAGKIIFTDFVSDSELAWVYNRAKLIVLPSLSEGFGLQVLEAFAANTPVVAADNGVYPEIAGKAAIYFNPHNPDEMTSAMKKVLEDPQLGHRLRQLGSQRLKHFSWSKMAQQTLDLYRNITSR